jgi:hypothetical protein
MGPGRRGMRSPRACGHTVFLVLHAQRPVPRSAFDSPDPGPRPASYFPADSILCPWARARCPIVSALNDSGVAGRRHLQRHRAGRGGVRAADPGSQGRR